MEEEKEILKSLAQGSHQAFKVIFRSYYAKVRAFIYGFVKDDDETEDLAQMVFIKIWDKREIFLSVRNFDSYLFTLVKYTVFNYIASKNAVYFTHDDEPEKLDNETPHEELVAKDLKLLIDMVVQNMPLQRRTVYRLSREKGLSNDQIAEQLGLQKKTVENHLNLALKELRSVIALAFAAYLMLINW